MFREREAKVETLYSSLPFYERTRRKFAQEVKIIKAKVAAFAQGSGETGE
jgi:hypothetical protein